MCSTPKHSCQQDMESTPLSPTVLPLVPISMTQLIPFFCYIITHSIPVVLKTWLLGCQHQYSPGNRYIFLGWGAGGGVFPGSAESETQSQSSNLCCKGHPGDSDAHLILRTTAKVIQ